MRPWLFQNMDDTPDGRNGHLAARLVEPELKEELELVKVKRMVAGLALDPLKSLSLATSTL